MADEKVQDVQIFVLVKTDARVVYREFNSFPAMDKFFEGRPSHSEIESMLNAPARPVAVESQNGM